MQFVQVLLTDEQALISRLALDTLLQDPERYVMTDEERENFERLAVFYGMVAQDPTAFPPTGANAARVKKVMQRVKGPAQPPSGRNKRKARQEKRRAFQKARRATRREDAEAYNRAQAQVEADMAEAAEIQREMEERLANEPKFDVVNINGETIIAGVPKSMLVPSEPEPSSMADAAAKGQIILPAGVEA